MGTTSPTGNQTKHSLPVLSCVGRPTPAFILVPVGSANALQPDPCSYDGSKPLELCRSQFRLCQISSTALPRTGSEPLSVEPDPDGRASDVADGRSSWVLARR